jgi:hypothetical protein
MLVPNRYEEGVRAALYPGRDGVAREILNNDAPVVVGHYHLNVTSIEERKKLWVDTLGGTPMKFGSKDVIRIPAVSCFFASRLRPARRSTISASRCRMFQDDD